ncbi:MAG: hypothetical protein AB8B57_02570 [Congregibacter sp.]
MKSICILSPPPFQRASSPIPHQTQIGNRVQRVERVERVDRVDRVEEDQSLVELTDDELSAVSGGARTDMQMPMRAYRQIVRGPLRPVCRFGDCAPRVWPLPGVR